MKRNYLVTGIVIFLLISGAVLVWEKTVKAPVVPPIPAPPVTPTPTVPAPPITPQPVPPTSQVPADWKTYRNEKMKFEIQYPPDWKVDEAESSIILYKGEKGAIIPGSPISPYGKTLSVGIVERGKTCGDCNIYSPHELKEMVINGYFTLATVYNNSRSSIFWVYSPDKDHVLGIDYSNPFFDEKERAGDGEILNLILSTFKFLE